MIEEIPLSGGIANPGAVVRVGDTVRRPAGPHTPAVHAFFDHLRERGFNGVPRPRGIDERNREILDFIDGDVPLPPFPAWAWREEALVSVAQLTRHFHDSAASFAPPPDAAWDFAAPVGWAGRSVGHHDICRENVIFRDGLAVAIVDFDFAGPADPIFDVAATAYYWMPFVAPEDLDDVGVEVDHAERLRVFVDAYGLPRADRRRMLDGFGAHSAWGERMVMSRIARGDVGFVEMAEGGWAGRKERANRWYARERGRLERALFRP